MSKYFPLKRVLAMIVSIIANTISWVPTAQQAFNDFVVTWIPSIDKNVNWLAIVSGIVLFVFVIWTLWDLSKKIEESENKKPFINVIPVPYGDMWYLEVTNNGEIGTFSAQVCIFNNISDSVGDRYDALWGKTNTNKSEIMNGQNDIIKLAAITYTDTHKYFDLKAYDTIRKSPYSVRHIEFEGFRDHHQQQYMQVTISSDPSLRGGHPIVREYSLYLNGMEELKPQKRRSIPEKYALGSDDNEEEKPSFTVNWLSDTWKNDNISLTLDGEIVLTIQKPIQVESIELIIGKEICASDWKSDIFFKSCSKSVSFHIPCTIARGQRVSKIKYIIDGCVGFSESFTIDIPAQPILT